MGIEPKDIDIATSATPDQVLKLFSKTFEKGKSFGVVSVLLGGHEFEVTTFRKEGSYFDGRHPTKVTWTDDKEDALRRDFTINGMFYDPLQKKSSIMSMAKKILKKKLFERLEIPATGLTRINFA